MSPGYFVPNTNRKPHNAPNAMVCMLIFQRNVIMEKTESKSTKTKNNCCTTCV